MAGLYCQFSAQLTAAWSSSSCPLGLLTFTSLTLPSVVMRKDRPVVPSWPRRTAIGGYFCWQTCGRPIEAGALIDGAGGALGGGGGVIVVVTCVTAATGASVCRLM